MLAENEELKERLNSAEFNVGNFIREMSDLLDSHELSTNVGSEENSALFNYQNNYEGYDANEEYEYAAKLRDKTKQGQDNSKKTLENLIQNKPSSSKSSANQSKAAAPKY